MDMLRFHRFTVGGAWVPEYGNPDVPHDFEFIYKLVFLAKCLFVILNLGMCECFLDTRLCIIFASLRVVSGRLR